MALRKKKNMVVNGHTFQPTKYYQLVKCVACSEFLFSVGYQCQRPRPCLVKRSPGRAGVGPGWRGGAGGNGGSIASAYRA